MSLSVLVVGVPSPAGCSPAQTWRTAAGTVRSRLAGRFGEAVSVEYAELFSPDMSRHPDIEAKVASGDALPPLVVIDGRLRFSGGKLNLSAIERAVANALADDIPHPDSQEVLVP